MSEPAALALVDEHDPSRLAGLRSLGGQALARDLVSLFLEHSREKLTAAHAALDARDLPTVAFAAHALKSSCGQLGVLSMQAACIAAERAASAGDGIGARAAVVDATAALDRARGWLESEMA